MSDPGYRVPEGEALIEDMACQLVYYPDIPEYRTILLSQLLELTNWRNWERDVDHKGKDAATSWKAANELTWGCWRMACLEQLQSDVSAILAFLQQSVPCCGDNITYGDSTTYITIIIPGDGMAPDTYGDTSVSDWDEWLEYLCHNANLWVDELIRAALTIGVALDTGGLSIGLLAAVMGAIAFFVVGGVLALPLLMVVIFGLSANVAATIFEDAAVDLEDARDSIVCAILSGRSVSDAVEDALSSGTAWDLLFSQIDYDSAMAILYEGGDGETYLEAETDDTCACLCLHASDLGVGDNDMIYQSAAGCQFEMNYWDADPYFNQLSGQVRFNYNGSDWCGPMKVIDTISVSDGLKFAAIVTYDQDNNVIDSYYSGTTTCVQDISQLVGDTVSRIMFLRHAPGAPWNGCGAGTIQITMTYHDAT